MWLAGKQDGRKTPKESSSQAAKTKNFVPQKQKTVKATNSQKKKIMRNLIWLLLLCSSLELLLLLLLLAVAATFALSILVSCQLANAASCARGASFPFSIFLAPKLVICQLGLYTLSLYYLVAVDGGQIRAIEGESWAGHFMWARNMIILCMLRTAVGDLISQRAVPKWWP